MAAEPPAVANGLIDRILVLAREHLGMELAYIGQVGADQQTITAANAAGEGPAVGLGQVLPFDDTYCARMMRGEMAQFVPDTGADPVAREVPVHPAAGIGAYVGVPIQLSNGSIYGTLCAVSATARSNLTVQDAEFMRMLAGVAAWEMERDLSGAASMQARAKELRDAIESGAVTLYYQPKMELDSGRIRSVEALARWIMPDGEVVQPDDFIPLATETGLDGLLTERVLEIAVAQAATWSAQGQPLRVAVNVPAGVLLSTGFARLVGETLDRHGVSPVWLEVELTESDVMRDAARAVPVLGSLHTMGIHLAIDDFGTGYSSLAYLRELRVNTVKVDKSFVIPLARPGADPNLVKAMIDLAHNLGLMVVAEGVEDADTARLLRDLGCETIQGYWLSRPVVAEAIPPLLDTRPMAAMTGKDRASDPRFHLSVMDADLERAGAEIDAAESAEAVTRALVRFVVRVGGSVVPAGIGGREAIPIDLALGAGPPLVVLAPEGTHLRGELEKWLPELIRRANLIG
ncbi:MAG: hypothetical protein NVSMB17_14450 [Candidatus Dormibacteria bacterium]